MSLCQGSDGEIDKLAKQMASEYTPEQLMEARKEHVREEIRKTLKRVALILTINDGLLSQQVDAACKVDRRKVLVEELIQLAKELQIEGDDVLQKTYDSVISEPDAQEDTSDSIRTLLHLIGGGL